MEKICLRVSHNLRVRIIPVVGVPTQLRSLDFLNPLHFKQLNNCPRPFFVFQRQYGSITTFLKAKIVVLWEENKSIKQIARELNITRNTIRRWVRCYQRRGDVECDKPGPRPRAYTDESERHREIVKRHTYWCWISSMKIGELVEVGGRMNSERYLEVLRDVMLPSVRVAYPEGQIYLVQDKSPDLNPIENLWGQMVLNWDPTQVKSRQNLDEEVYRTWELMRNTNACSNMVSSMKSRLKQVEDREGFPLRY